MPTLSSKTADTRASRTQSALNFKGSDSFTMTGGDSLRQFNDTNLALNKTSIEKSEDIYQQFQTFEEQRAKQIKSQPWSLTDLKLHMAKMPVIIGKNKVPQKVRKSRVKVESHSSTKREPISNQAVFYKVLSTFDQRKTKGLLKKRNLNLNLDQAIPEHGRTRTSKADQIVVVQGSQNQSTLTADLDPIIHR